MMPPSENAMDPDTPGKRLQKLRAWFALSQEQFARKCDLAKGTVNKLEKIRSMEEISDSPGNIGHLRKIAEACELIFDKLYKYLAGEISLDELFGKQLQPSTSPPLTNQPAASAVPPTRVTRATGFWVALAAGIALLIGVLAWAFNDGPPKAPRQDQAEQKKGPLPEKPEVRAPNPVSPGWLCSVYAPNKEEVWIAGENGLIVHMRTPFENWIPENTKTRTKLLSIDARQSQMRWAAGESGTILHFNGLNWEKQGTGTAGDLRWIHFLGDKGWAVGAGGLMLKTENAGKKWQPIDPGRLSNGDPFKADISCIFFISELKGWAVSEGGLLSSTENGGKKWTHVSLWENRPGEEEEAEEEAERLWRILFHTNELRWIVGDGGAIFAKHGEGPWQEYEPRVTTEPLHDVDFVDEESGWIVGKEIILKTTTGGNEWEPDYQPTDIDLWSVDMIDKNTGWAVGVKGGKGVILRRTETGWQVHMTSPRRMINRAVDDTH